MKPGYIRARVLNSPEDLIGALSNFRNEHPELVEAVADRLRWISSAGKSTWHALTEELHETR